MTARSAGTVPALELAVQDVAGVRVAVRLRVERVELCSALALGGLTPSLAVVEAAVAAAGAVGVHVLVRPRAGDFRYDADEVAVMVADVRRAVVAGADGVVVGALDGTGLPDLAVLDRLREAAEGVQVTFHRAVDVSADPVTALDLVAGSGVDRVLTSGGAARAVDGADRLRRMVGVAAGRLEVMAGAGVDAAAVPALLATGVDALHFSAKRRVAARGIPLGQSEDGHDVTDEGLAAAVLAAVRGG
ncbi:copper homeostasis protein CutC [Phycicoccus sp. 3266]|uniref:copper homeostasis protein CutC n=1 Tax=Phycicoccus sp. 3266 TaxID=2817751 RepID=UPI002866DC2E|nr:copper homeostasis protein CutC [Phycicoccus sp. 3266]MDR6862004.1 copper homeostasis protein [Phycicoccus sp. 3266]